LVLELEQGLRRAEVLLVHIFGLPVYPLRLDVIIVDVALDRLLPESTHKPLLKIRLYKYARAIPFRAKKPQTGQITCKLTLGAFG
jgi:hypothetical protein